MEISQKYLNKFKECIIHIGTDKTGTKTIQWFFGKNRVNLSRNGILYPKSFGEMNHDYLTLALANFDKKIRKRTELGLFHPDDIKKFLKEILISFKEEIIQGNYTKLLISSESLYRQITTIEEIKRLKNLLGDFVESFKIIVYVRPQHEHQISGFSTRCLLGNKGKKILQDDEKTKFLLSYDKIISMWASVFEKENVFPKIFAKNEFLDGDIKKDFVSFLSLNWNEFEDTENRNTSISADAQQFLLEINQYLPVFVENKLNANRESIREIIRQKNGNGLVPSRSEAENYFEIFSKSNEELRKAWFPNRKKLFEVDFAKYPEKSDLKTDYRFAFQIFAELWSAKQRELFTLQQENRELKNSLGEKIFF